MKLYLCPCGHEVVSDRHPEPIRWDDGHVCTFYEQNEEEDWSDLSTPSSKYFRKGMKRKEG